MLSSALCAHGIDTVWVSTAAAATRSLYPSTQLVLLDLGLPDRDGVSLCRELRTTRPDLVVVVLSARSTELDVVLGLQSGADDYLIKPFRFGEVLARVQAHLARRRRNSPETDGIQVGTLRVEVAAHRCWFGTSELQLAPREFALLARLACSAGTVVSRETLISEVWDEHWFGSTKTLDVHVAGIRRQLQEVAAYIDEAPPVIATVRGVGYRLER